MTTGLRYPHLSLPPLLPTAPRQPVMTTAPRCLLPYLLTTSLLLLLLSVPPPPMPTMSLRYLHLFPPVTSPLPLTQQFPPTMLPQPRCQTVMAQPQLLQATSILSPPGRGSPWSPPAMWRSQTWSVKERDRSFPPRLLQHPPPSQTTRSPQPL